MTEVSLSKNKELAYEDMEQVLACSSTHSLKAHHVGKKVNFQLITPSVSYADSSLKREPYPKFTNRKD